MNDNFEIILSKYFSGTADETDRKIIEEWKAESEYNRKEFERYRILWEKGGETTISYTDAQVESALNQTKKRIPDFRRTGYFRIIRQAAAILIVSLLLSSLYNYFGTRKIAETGKTAIKEIVAFNGMATRVNLPDGTVVDLFPGSKLIYSDNFSNDIREIKLSGQGYFNVVHNEEKPFVVKTGEMRVKVLGTEFNIRAYADENFIETVLVTGKVQIEIVKNGKITQLGSLRPYQRSVYNRKTNKIAVYKEPDVFRYVNWTKGVLAFDGDSLGEVVKELEAWYNVDIVVKDQELQKFRFTGTFSGETIDEVLLLLKFSSDSKFKYKITEGDIKKGKYIKRKIILYN